MKSPVACIHSTTFAPLEYPNHLVFDDRLFPLHETYINGAFDTGIDEHAVDRLETSPSRDR